MTVEGTALVASFHLMAVYDILKADA